MDYDFDVIVIGSGAGGGTAASECARLGCSVLLLERGLTLTTADCTRMHQSEQLTLIDKAPYDDRWVETADGSRRLYMGGVTGGSTSVYGAALLRPARADFQPGQFYLHRLSKSVWDWPIHYEELSPWYDQAETLFDVAGHPADTMAPIEAPRGRIAESVLPLARINETLVSNSRRNGLHPFQLPLAIRSSTCLRCDRCAGFPCPNGSRRSSSQLISDTISGGHRLLLRTGAELESIVRNSHGQIDHVRVRTRSADVEYFRAKRYVLAAGAIGSAGILLKSGFSHPMIGRNFMMHYSPAVAGIFTGRTDADRDFIKQIGFTDFYFGTAELREKMGLVQSLPAPGPRMLGKTGLRFTPDWLRNGLRRRMLPLVGIVEDLPSESNRVVLRSDGSLKLEHAFSDYDRARGAALARSMKTILRGCGAAFVAGGELPVREHVGHQCGTLRFGTDRKHAVVDRDCRMFDQPELFVADGSVLPTSLGVGPSLTIMANALRVAEIVSQEC